MRLIDNITFIDPTDIQQSKLSLISEKIRTAKNDYLQSCIVNFQSVDLERENGFRDAEIKLNRYLSQINEEYKVNILKVDKNYKKVGLWVHSFAGVELIDLLGKAFDFEFHRRVYSKRSKVKFTVDKFETAMKYATALLFAKYETVYSFMFEATVIKILCDYFECEQADYQNIKKYVNNFGETAFSEIKHIIDTLDFKPLKEMKGSTGKSKVRKELPTKEMFEIWINSGRYSLTEIKTMIAQQYNVSARTIHRKMDEYGLIKKYKKQS